MTSAEFNAFLFFLGCASIDPVDPDYVPSMYLGYNVLTSTPKIKQGRHERAKSRQTKRLIEEMDLIDRHLAASVLMDLQCSVNMDADEELSPEKRYDEGYYLIII